jgi:hypothetical protein
LKPVDSLKSHSPVAGTRRSWRRLLCFRPKHCGYYPVPLTGPSISYICTAKTSYQRTICSLVVILIVIRTTRLIVISEILAMQTRRLLDTPRLGQSCNKTCCSVLESLSSVERQNTTTVSREYHARFTHLISTLDRDFPVRLLTGQEPPPNVLGAIAQRLPPYRLGYQRTSRQERDEGTPHLLDSTISDWYCRGKMDEFG